MTYTRSQIIAAAIALPANADLDLLAWAIGFKAGTQPLCSDGWLDDMGNAIWRGAKIGDDAVRIGEVGRDCQSLTMASVLENVRRAALDTQHYGSN